MLAFLVGMQGRVAFAQVKGSPDNTVNAMDYRYQYFDGTHASFADSIRFRDRFYNLAGYGLVADWEADGDQMSPLAGWNTRLAFGYRYTPVHATEVDFIFGGGNKGRVYGVDANYVMNLNNFVLRQDSRNRFEAMFIAGLSYRYADDHAYGLNSGLRVQWSPHKKLGIYVEPKVNIMASASQSRTLSTQPSLSAGIAFRYHTPYHPFSYYLTEFAKLNILAFKTNLLSDLAMVPNLGVEVYLGGNFTVSANWMYAWWKNDETSWYWRTYGGNLAVRKWFGKQAAERRFTGHHIGLYGQCLTYDFAVGGRGQIGGVPEGTLWDKPNFGAGVEYGYSLPVAAHLNLDFSIGAGYFGGEYREYIAQDECYVWQATKRRHWIGPSKAEVSLVWILGSSWDNKGKGGKR